MSIYPLMDTLIELSKIQILHVKHGKRLLIVSVFPCATTFVAGIKN